MNTQTARSRAVATQDAAIAINVAKIEEARKAPNAVENMAGRLAMSPGKLQQTLMNTVFKGASPDEFAALIVVANAYGLNPLTKEIYAFPGKGGITPIVSVDGWARIMNEHPQFDGIEFNDIVDEKGNLYAIESVIYRRDRTHAIKVTEYMDECRGNGPGWQKVPKRMLRHRALIQGARIAFGFSGIYAEGDEVEAATFVGTVQQDGGDNARNVAIPLRRQEAHGPATGGIVDDEETARRLDAETDGWQEGPADADTGERTDTTDLIAMYEAARTQDDIARADKAANAMALSDDADVEIARTAAVERL